ncbi:MAG TPA: type II toxin-antitoxin system RelE/ParE family toxin [Verrucomicrobiae bacterium]|nr:type II toxin-antitoxin system RelE/ParE family toxin [Verrucomicrobiae bacterium]
MDWRIDWTAPSLDDLAHIVRTIAEDNKDAAVRVGDRIVDHVELLKKFPEIGPVFRRRVKSNIRLIVCRPFKIYYRVVREKSLVEILHVWHGARQDPIDL